ncbi:MAG TPA: META domain-containing protein [Nocardioidaceae bacterium]
MEHLGRRGVAWAVVAVLLLSGCARPGSPTGPDRLDLDGQWHLATGRDDAGTFDLAGREITLTVEGAEASGTSACNLYGGRVDVAGDEVTISQVAGTEMACEPDVMDLEQRYVAALLTVDRGTRDADRLTLSGPEVTLDFDAAPAVRDAALVGTTWTLESIIDGDSVSTPGRPGELQLHEDGRLVAALGCGPMRGRYSLRDDRLVMESLQVRAPAAGTCPADVERQHDHVVRVLRDSPVVTVEGDRLTLLTDAGQGLELRAE